MQARFLEAVGRADEAILLYQDVARDEERIARRLDRARRKPEAAVNWVSAASCWRQARHQTKAIQLLDKVLARPEISDTLRAEVIALRQEWSERSREEGRRTIPGIFRNGTVYPLEKISIAEGAVVTITLPSVHG
jgi:hypothetical protein